MDYDKPIDHQDVLQLRNVVEEYTKIIDQLNNKIREFNDNEKSLRIEFSKRLVMDSSKALSWENKMIRLMSLGEEYIIICNNYSNLKTEITILNNKRQEIEERLKAYKKIFDVTPKG